ncbi:hypothetical protein JW756_05680 [Candidatus Woesearchaeota archaeon]|nr:hypothetical protein [Candidatus Woesearchaeota archaeon]
MAAIPGWVYLVIGVAMAAMSKIVESSSKKPGNFALFFWLGVAFIVIGLGKLVFKALKKDKKPAKEPTLTPTYQKHPQHPQQKHQQQYQAHHLQQHTIIQDPQNHVQHQAQQPHQVIHQQFHSAQSQHHIDRAQPQNIPQHLSIINCPACNTKHYSYANYCMRCGTKMKKN